MHGLQARQNIQTNIQRYSASSSLPSPDVCACYIQEVYLPAIQTHYVEGLEEMRGIADGAEVPLSDIILLNARYDLSRVQTNSTHSNLWENAPAWHTSTSLNLTTKKRLQCTSLRIGICHPSSMIWTPSSSLRSATQNQTTSQHQNPSSLSPKRAIVLWERLVREFSLEKRRFLPAQHAFRIQDRSPFLPDSAHVP
jgi:hypothetical protein